MKTTRQTTWASSITVLVAAALLLEMTTAVQYFSTRHGITNQLMEIARHDLSETGQTARLKQDVEETIDRLLPEIERMTESQSLDSLYLTIEETLMQQDQVAGIDYCRVVREDAPHDGTFIYKDEQDQLQRQRIVFDYTQRSWYREGQSGNGFWSEPYMGKYKEILMCTYSHPVRDREGRTVAVIGADVPLYKLSAIATQLYSNHHYSLLPVIGLHVLGLMLLAFIIWRSIHNVRSLSAVAAEKDRIAGELAVAHRIQQAMLPKLFPPFPERNDVDIYASLTPAREVGGDFYDYLLRNETLFFCIGDVSGKGVPAALVMAMARSAFRMLTEHESAPEYIMAQMNDSMARDNDYNMFITLFIGALDLQTGHLRYTNGGHKAPLIGTTPLPIKANLPIGVMPNQKFQPQEAQIAQGDTLFLYTDGLTEAEDAENKQFGTERMLDICSTAATEGVETKTLVTRMSQAVHAFVGDTEQSDDLTMLAIRYLQQPADSDICHISLPCDINETPRLGEWVEEVCQKAGFSPAAVMQANLAIEEAVVNVMKYAYPNGTSGEVQIESIPERDGMRFVITDSGQPFDPTMQKEADTSLTAEERPVGGLGIHLMRRLMDEVSYKRLGGKNILTMRKRFNNK